MDQKAIWFMCKLMCQVGFHHGKLYGLPDTSVKEAKERVRTAIKNSSVEFQSKKIVVNLAPADTKKEGSSYDLPIAIAFCLLCFLILIFLDELSLNKFDRFKFVLYISHIFIFCKKIISTFFDSITKFTAFF